MKIKKTYQEEVEKLLKAIDISIDAYRKYPPKNWTQDIVNMVTENLEKDRKQILNADKKFRTLASLKYDIESVFTYFQEGTGEAVEYFWHRIRETELDYVRENKLEKILKRGKIKGNIEYDFVTDMIVAAEQTGMINQDEREKLNIMIGDYERK